MQVSKAEAPEVQGGKSELEAGSFQDQGLQSHLEKKVQGCPDTGSTSSDQGVTELTAMLQKLSLQLQKQDQVMQQQAEQINELKTVRSRQEAPSAPAEPSAADALGPSATEDEPSFDAAKQRLRRMCKPRKDGSMEVPPNVLEEWNKKGTARTALIRLFIEKGCNKDAEACNTPE